MMNNSFKYNTKTSISIQIICFDINSRYLRLYPFIECLVLREKTECEKRIKGYGIIADLAYKYNPGVCLCGPVIFGVVQYHDMCC